MPTQSSLRLTEEQATFLWKEARIECRKKFYRMGKPYYIDVEDMVLATVEHSLKRFKQSYDSSRSGVNTYLSNCIHWGIQEFITIKYEEFKDVHITYITNDENDCYGVQEESLTTDDNMLESLLENEEYNWVYNYVLQLPIQQKIILHGMLYNDAISRIAKKANALQYQVESIFNTTCKELYKEYYRNFNV